MATSCGFNYLFPTRQCLINRGAGREGTVPKFSFRNGTQSPVTHIAQWTQAHANQNFEHRIGCRGLFCSAFFLFIFFNISSVYWVTLRVSTSQAGNLAEKKIPLFLKGYSQGTFTMGKYSSFFFGKKSSSMQQLKIELCNVGMRNGDA